MTESTRQQWEQIIQETAATLVYPPTPDIAGRVRERLAIQQRASSRQWAVGRRLAWSVAAVLLLLVGSLLFVPELRAALLRVLQVGPIRVFVDETLPAATALPTVTHAPVVTATADLSAVVTSAATSTAVRPTPTAPPHSMALAQLGEPITLAEAEEQMSFPIVLPSYPKGIGEPEAVYLHQSGPVTAVTLVWFSPENPEQIWFTITQIPVSEFEFALKWARAEHVLEFYLNGQRAIWIEGPHQIQLVNPERVSPVMIASNVLIWEEGDMNMTYRLEGNMELQEAKAIAESLE